MVGYTKSCSIKYLVVSLIQVIPHAELVSASKKHKDADIRQHDEYGQVVRFQIETLVNNHHQRWWLLKRKGMSFLA